MPLAASAAPHPPTTHGLPVHCSTCRHDLTGIAQGSPCPGCGAPVTVSLKEPEPLACIRCAYDLHGLPTEGLCPECGTPVADSKYGVLLRYSGSAHLARLNAGVVTILGSILLQVPLWIVMFAADAADFDGGVISSLAFFGVLLLGLTSQVGWWLFTAPDPRNVGMISASASRRLLRIMMVVQAVILLTPVLFGLLAAVGVISGLVFVFSFLVLPLALVAGAVKFFAAMCYLRWLAPRLPSQAVHARATLLLWLGPVLCTVVVVVGPLIALGLYAMLLESVRRHIAAIRGVPAA